MTRRARMLNASGVLARAAHPRMGDAALAAAMLPPRRIARYTMSGRPMRGRPIATGMISRAAARSMPPGELENDRCPFWSWKAVPTSKTIRAS